MELSINGHKVVGSGSVKNATKQSGVVGYLQYCVTNGICIVSMNGLTTSTTGSQLLSSDLPKSKFGLYCCALVSGSGNTFCGNAFINGNTGDLYVNKIVNSDFGGQLVYPVADDWHE